MTTTLQQDLANSLKSYSIAIDYWEPLAGDTFLYIGHRQFLQAHWDDLSDAQKKTLAAADKKALALAAAHYEEVTEDVEDLRLIADIIQGDAGQKAA